MMGSNVNAMLAYRHAHRWVCIDCGDEQVAPVATTPQSMSWPRTARRGPIPAVQAQREAWQAAYLADPEMTAQAVADRFGVKLATVYSGLHALKTPMHRKRGGTASADQRRIETIRTMLVDERLTLDQAGARLGITRERVRQIAKRHLGIVSSTFRHEDTLARHEALTKTCSTCGEVIPATVNLHDHWREKGHTKVTSEDLEKYLAMVADYDAGMKNEDIQSKYNCRPGLVYRALRYVGRTHNRRKTGRAATRQATDARMDAIEADLRSKKWTVSEIAERHECSTTWVHIIGRNRNCGLTRKESNALIRAKR